MGGRDLLFVVDGTGSMAAFLDALRSVLPQFAHLTGLMSPDQGRIGVLVYRDYDERPVVEFSGWSASTVLDTLETFVKLQTARGGGDGPEAAKTAAWAACDLLVEGARVFWFCDAPPHHLKGTSWARHIDAEKEALQAAGRSFDWIEICRRLAAERAEVHVFLSTDGHAVSSFYAVLAGITGGRVLHLRTCTSEKIGRHAVGAFLALAGHAYDFEGDVDELTSPSSVTSPSDPQTSAFEDQLPDAFGRVAHPPVSTRLFTSGGLGGDGLVARFAADAGYRDAVYAAFDRVLRPDAVGALTYNSVFGALWRAICRSRDPAVKERRDALVARMGTTVSGLHGGLKEAVQAYLEMSYDKSAEVELAVAAAPDRGVMVTFDPTTRVTRAELMELGRSCHRSVLAKAGALLTGANIGPGTTGVPLSTPDLFGVLPHLAVPGTMFSRRPAAILAVLAITTSSALSARAVEFLEGVKGAWIDWSLPECYAADFVRLVSKVPPHLLTEEDAARVAHLCRVAGLLVNGKTDLRVEVGYSSKATVRPDRKEVCTGCGELRSFTLLTPDTHETPVCGLCLVGCGGDKEKLGPEESRMCECRTCRVHYAVVEAPNVSPKCHFCRIRGGLGKVARTWAHVGPKARCSLCANVFLHQTGTPEDGWTCPPCEANGTALTETKTTTVRAYLLENPTAAGLEIPDLDAFFRAGSVFVAKDLACALPFVDPLDTVDTFGGKKVLNAAAVRKTIGEWVACGDAEREDCALCFEPMSKGPNGRLFPACGRKGCGSKACGACLDAWYGEPKPGRIVLTANLRCPFCKRPPVDKTLRRHGRDAMAIVRSDGVEGWYLAWCTACYRLEPAVEKACTQIEGVPVVSGFRCEGCNLTSAELVTKDCPGCGVTTEKVSGCGHMTCVCDTHWCWACRHVAGPDTIYHHMRRAHGGIGFEYDGESDEDSGDDEW